MSLKTLTLANDASTAYTFDTLGRLDKMSFKNDSATEIDYVDLAYNSQGLISDNTRQRTRYFFHGLTEEVRKVSVANAHSDTAFLYTEKEDGVSASDWAGGDFPATPSSVSNSARRSDVIRVHATGYKQTAYTTATWDETQRVLSMWVTSDGAGTPMISAHISTSGGAGQAIYYAASGTNTYDSGSRLAKYYLGSGAFGDGTKWVRFERNIEADFEALSGGTSWSNTDAIEVNPGRAVSGQSNAYMWLDSVRFSNSQTTEHLTLGPGAIGQILRQRTINASTYAVTDRWFHYDQVGSVMHESDANG